VEALTFGRFRFIPEQRALYEGDKALREALQPEASSAPGVAEPLVRRQHHEDSQWRPPPSGVS
jgi:hypothetical protein